MSPESIDEMKWFGRLSDRIPQAPLDRGWFGTPVRLSENTGQSTGHAAHDPTQVESPFDFDRLEAGVAGGAAL
jgi:hypothetical protein